MNFEPGQRALFQDIPPSKKWPRFRAVSLGLDNFVMQLNAKDDDGETLAISGRVVDVNVYAMENFVLFRPDGWPLPDELGRGVILDAKELRPYAEANPEFPGRVTDNLGRELSKEEIEKLVEKRLRKRL